MAPITPAKLFEYEINKLAREHETYIDAIIHWCTANNADPETEAGYVKKNRELREKIAAEAERHHLLKPSTSAA
jgi:hypothetical protein